MIISARSPTQSTPATASNKINKAETRLRKAQAPQCWSRLAHNCNTPFISMFSVNIQHHP